LLRFIDTRETLLTSTRVMAPCAAFVKVEGASSAGIIIEGGDLSKAAMPLAFANDAHHDAASLRR